MTKEEALAKIKELEQFIEDINNPVGFKDDPIFLLSIDEYKRYKALIPCAPWWWLRSPGSISNHAAYVHNGGSVHYTGSPVYDGFGCVRPAIRKNIGYPGNTFPYKGWTWITLDDKLAIAAMPITMRRYDDTSSDYETSEIRHWLLDWYTTGEVMFSEN